MVHDDRITCSACRRSRAGFCTALRIRCLPDAVRHRCEGYKADPDGPGDVRSAEQRWPGITGLRQRTAAALRLLPKYDKRLKAETQVQTLLAIQGRPAPARDQ